MPRTVPFAQWSRDLCVTPKIGMTVDPSRMGHPDDLLARMEPAFNKAFDHMQELERGVVANPDEGRQVGHYWLRAPDLAPSQDIRQSIEQMVLQVKTFAAHVHSGTIAPPEGGKFTDVLVVGIGGSALGPQLAARALGTACDDPLYLHFLDNTDPDGLDFVLDRVRARFPWTLVLVISKSGGTKETRNGMLEVKAAMEARHVLFARHAVAITGEGSALDQLAIEDGWLARFPMWDWVGGRTSETSAVGLLPAALQGVDIDAFLAGARDADAATRVRDVRQNPAALLAAMWHFASNGRGEKDMVVLPYKDRLDLFSRYLQQLIMESLGKEKDLAGRTVHQGLTVYGNKGSTDQHAYVQQLRDGVANFFVTFLEVLRDRAPGRGTIEVEPGVTSGDYLFGFFLGTRRALHESGRPSMTITLDELSPRTLGALVAVFERAVGLYAALVGINAYHQPGVEAGKKAAGEVLALQGRVVEWLEKNRGTHAVDAIARGVGTGDVETVTKICLHLAANDRLAREGGDPRRPWEAMFGAR
ncbi:MAG: glucose-6-phosphate isomerase [Deltaproteobacteria bacterium]|nr:glucose-6-phosphate isomerase [Deltaproteobacteria bacterium]